MEKESYEFIWRPTIGERAPFYAWFIKRNSDGERTHHIHMVEPDNASEDRILFRDHLRAHPEEVERYESLKHDLVLAHAKDRAAYTQGKTAFIAEMVRQAHTAKRSWIMRYPTLVLVLLTGVLLHAQNTFEYQQDDTTYVMQEYYMVFLKAGEVRSKDSTEAVQFQNAHLAHLERMGREGHLSIVGPFGDAGEVRGICIYNTATRSQADSLAHLDPMVQSGRLNVEIRPWWGAKGSRLK